MATIENTLQGFFLHYDAGDIEGALYAAYLYADSEDLTVTIEIGSIVWRPDTAGFWAGGQGNAIANRLNSQDPRLPHPPYVIFSTALGDGYDFVFQQTEDFNFRIGTPSGGGTPPPLEDPASPAPDPIPADIGGLIGKRKREVPEGKAEQGQGESGVIPTSAKRPARVVV